VTVPTNSTATVAIPADRGSDVTEGGRSPDRVAGVRVLGVADGVARLEVGAGTYDLRVTSAS
jgi:hypothetical protein